MIYRRPGGAIIRRPGGGLAASTNCCCNNPCFACSLAEVTATLPAFTEGSAAIPCLECDTIPAGPYTVPRDDTSYIEGQEFSCCWRLIGGFTGAGADCELDLMQICIVDNAGDDGTDVAITLSLFSGEFEPGFSFPITFIRQMPKTEFCAAYGTPIELYPVEDPPSIAAMCSTTGNATVQFGP